MHIVKMPQIFSKFIPPHPNCKLVDRTTPYGNPFIIGIHGDRDMVCEMFDEWVMMPEQRALVERAKKELRGHNLLCWCWPARCHAGTWIRIVNGEDQ